MDNQLLLTRLQQLAGTLRITKSTPSGELKTLHRRLAEELIQNPELSVSGNRMHHENTREMEPVADEPADFSYLADLFERRTIVEKKETAPLIFRRETAFRNNLLGNSVPLWGTGLAVTDSYGPFIDEHGLQVWFDFFLPVKMVHVYLQGNAQPVLLLPIWGTLTAKKSYRIEAGSVWIASHLIAKTAQLQGYYTGLKITGGTLDLSVNTIISNGSIIINNSNNATLNLELDQHTVSAPSAEAGFDATKTIIHLPQKCTLQFNTLTSSFIGANASCTVFDNDTLFKFNNASPVWINFLTQVLIPYTVTTNSNEPGTFSIQSSASKLCTFSKSAAINTNSGWLLPAAKISPQQLGQAEGTGALCIGLLKGIDATWKGLKGGATRLNFPAIIAEPGMVSVIDFFAANTYGTQRWELWRNANTKHHSTVTLGFTKAFPFIFVSASTGSEGVIYFCTHKTALDRPVDANGSPFTIQSSIALAGVLQTGTTFHATLLDNDLLFDGNYNKPEAYKKYSIALRNALFNVSAPYSLFLAGELVNDNQVTKGRLAMMYGIYLYLPTLPDPYVASYTMLLRRDAAAGEFGRLRMALAAFVKWPDPAQVTLPADAENNPAYVYFKFAPLDQSLLRNNAATVTPFNRDVANVSVNRDFQTGVSTFNQSRLVALSKDLSDLPVLTTVQEVTTTIQQPTTTASLRNRIHQTIESGDIKPVIGDMEANPLLNHIKDKSVQLNETLNVAVQQAERATHAAFAGNNLPGASTTGASSYERGINLFTIPDAFMLLDVSSNADQLGVSFGTAIRVNRTADNETFLGTVDTNFNVAGAAQGQGMILQIFNMDVVTPAPYVRAVTLPQISWEPISNIPLEIAGPPDPGDLITVTPGLLVYDNDGYPTRIYSESPYPVPITPLSVTRHFIKEYNDKKIPRQLQAAFTLPFAMVAQAAFERSINNPANKNASLHFHMPWFNEVRGGWQIKALAPKPASFFESNSFKGWTIQLDHNIKWFLLGLPITGSTLGKNVKDIFNNVFTTSKPKVPLEKIEFSGYGATMFSNWLNDAAAIADVSQAKFDVLVGRTAHEVVQVRSVMYMCTGIVHVVRTITLMRSPNGYVFRSDSGWKAESDAFYNCDYKIDFLEPVLTDVNNTYTYHPGAVKGVSNVREIKDYPAGGNFTASFSLNESGLPAKLGRGLADWKKIFAQINSLDDKLPVDLQAVVFDADVHMDNVTGGGVKDAVYGDFKVQSRKMLGYVQLAPTGILIPPPILAALLKFQNGSLGGPVNSIINTANSGQKMRLERVDINPAFDNSGNYIFPAAARGSLILPQDGSWSVVKQHTDTGDVKPVEEGQSVPLIKPNGNTNFRIANPADIIQQTASKINFGVLQSTGTQKLLFDVPQFTNGVQKLLSSQTYFADAYKLLNSKGVFPNIVNALQLTNAEKEIQILGEGLMKMADRDIDVTSLLPANYQYAFIDEPGILKIYAEYSNAGGGNGNLKLGIDSTAALADKWKSMLSNIRVVVDLGPFDRIMWVDGNFNAGSGLKTAYDKPNLQFGPLLDPVVDILRILATLTGDDFDKGMDVGMSNAPDNWEYKFNCSKEIPVIKFPSPLQLTINPNPPLKLEAGLKVGFYFNEVIAVPTGLEQLVPACGAYVGFYGRLQVQCFTLAVASVYAVGQVDLGIQADTKAGIYFSMKMGFGAEIVVGLPVVANVAVLYMVEVEMGIGTTSLDVGAFLLFRGSAEICGGLVAVCIQIEAGGSVHRDFVTDTTSCIAQVTFSIDICVLWVIDIEFSETWQESRQIA